MRLDELPSPGIFTGALRLRKLVNTAISFAEIASDNTGGNSTQGQSLAEFFQYAADHCRKLTKQAKTQKSGSSGKTNEAS